MAQATDIPDEATVRAELAAELVLPNGTYPLQHKCPNPWCQKGTGCQCNGLGYIFNDAPDALWDAVRAKGWRPGRFEFQEHGDLFVIETYRDYGWGKRWEGIGFCNPHKFGPDEGLRGQAAIELAVYRAMEEEQKEATNGS